MDSKSGEQATKTDVEPTTTNTEERVDERELETEQHPMSEAMYNHLCWVRGFVELNGSSYEEYCAKWGTRRKTQNTSPKEEAPDGDRT